jgi:hypothetical protein
MGDSSKLKKKKKCNGIPKDKVRITIIIGDFDCGDCFFKVGNKQACNLWSLKEGDDMVYASRRDHLKTLVFLQDLQISTSHW